MLLLDALLISSSLYCSVKLLRKDKNGSPESMSKLPQMAKQLEVSLYRSAQSFDAYVDMSTLKKRLQRIAAEVQRKTRGPNRGPSDSSGRGPGSDDRNRYNDPQSRSQQPPQQQQQKDLICTLTT